MIFCDYITQPVLYFFIKIFKILKLEIYINFLGELYKNMDLKIVQNIWFEMTVIPFLFVILIFLAVRFGVKAEINRKFVELVFSTFVSAVLEVLSNFMPSSFWFPRLFFSSVVINSWCLMRYIAAYVHFDTSGFKTMNDVILFVGSLSPFMFHSSEALYSMLSLGAASLLAFQGFGLQIVHQKYYENGQFLVMNLLFIMLLDAFLIQFLFNVNLQFIYMVSTAFLFFTFFYLESPTYRQLVTAQYKMKKARIDIENSIQKATKSSKAKSDFLASTSHEVRTPMNAILGMNEMILNEAKDAETINASIDIKNAGNHLLTMINNILDISKIESGKMELYDSEYHLYEIIQECERYVFDRVENKRLDFIEEIDPTIPEHLYGDALRLRQILINLLDNAIKYTEHGHIKLKIDYEEKSRAVLNLKISVEDTGIGMKEDDITMLFEPFNRLNLIETRHILGVGLGLTLVRNIVQIMGGKIDVTSKYGEGSTFSLEIPQHLVFDDNTTMQEYKAKNNETPKETEQDILNFKCPSTKILIVDDTPVNLVVAKGMLRDCEAKIDTVESGEEALKMMNINKYNIVFLDHKMPGMDGVETLHKAKMSHPEIKFVALTANVSSGSYAEYIDYGFDDYLPKPFSKLAMMKLKLFYFE